VPSIKTKNTSTKINPMIRVLSIIGFPCEDYL
jgi:hypothetical protein